MRNRILGLMSLAGIFGALLSFAIASDTPDKAKRNDALAKTASGTPLSTVLTVPNMTAWFRYDGLSNHAPSGDNGTYYPKGTGNVFYQDGIVYGARVYTGNFPTSGGVPAATQSTRVDGGTYGVGTQGGWVRDSAGIKLQTALTNSRIRIYRVRRDYKFLADNVKAQEAGYFNETDEAGVSQAQIDAVMAQYETDWTNWPVDLGAPYIERNGTPGFQQPPAFNAAEGAANFTPDSLISGNYDEPGVSGVDKTSPADQVIWSVYNDLNVTQAQGFEGSLPMGIEVQKTIWAYKRSDELGNLYFGQYRFINQGVGASQFYLDSMYVCQWSDPDLGSFSDDLIGCDTVRSMGFVYNANANDATYQKYALAPPASGYDFLAGPTIAGAASDSAVKNLTRVGNLKNLGMSGFAYFSAGSPYTDPPGGSANYSTGTGRWWNMLRGFAPLGDLVTPPQDYVHQGFPATKFPLWGDPVAGTGFLDGTGNPNISFAPGDRRLLVTTGPFRMAPGDTQDIYIGTLVGLGSDRKSSIAVLKFNDQFVQNTFDALFAVPKPPAAPDVNVTELDEELVLEWASNSTRVSQTETKVGFPGGYTFEGYNVYQLPSSGSQLSAAKRIITYDKTSDPAVVLSPKFDVTSGQVLTLPVQFGANSGIKRMIDLKRDYVGDIDKLYNGTDYYFAVTSYAVATVPGFIPAALESDITVLTVRPKRPFKVNPASVFGDTISGTHTGPSDGAAYAQVISPTGLTGATYKIAFKADNSYFVIRNSTGDTVLNNQTNQTADDNSPVADGMQVKVVGAPNGTKDFLHVANPSGAINPPTYSAWSTFNSQGFPDASGSGAALSGGGPSIGDYGGNANARWGIHVGGGTGPYDDGSASSFVARVFRGTNFSRFVPYDFELRFTAAGGKAYLAFTSGAVIDVPFELWNVGIGTPTDASDDFRMIPWVNDADGNGRFNLEAVDHPVSGSDNDPITDWIYWMDPNPKTPGSAGYNAFVAAGGAYDGSQGTGSEVMARMVLVGLNHGSVSAVGFPAAVLDTVPKTGNTFRIISTKPNTSADQFSINTAPRTAVGGQDVELDHVGRVTVFPNPYYAFNNEEQSRFQRFVRFSNLPTNATIRIFNLAGQLVRTIAKSDNSQWAQWDLLNASNFPVASGMYIAHVDMPDLGTSKVLKLAIIQEQEILDSY